MSAPRKPRTAVKKLYIVEAVTMPATRLVWADSASQAKAHCSQFTVRLAGPADLSACAASDIHPDIAGEFDEGDAL